MEPIHNLTPYLRPVLILFSYLFMDLPSDVFLSGFTTIILCRFRQLQWTARNKTPVQNTVFTMLLPRGALKRVSGNREAPNCRSQQFHLQCSGLSPAVTLSSTNMLLRTLQLQPLQYGCEHTAALSTGNVSHEVETQTYDEVPLWGPNLH
jgi:hypothetical protein